MLILFISTTLTLTLTFSSPANIQPSAAHNIRPLTLESCIKAALKNHPSIQAFQRMEESKSALSKSLEAQTYPGAEFNFRSTGYKYSPYNYRTLESTLNFTWDLGKWKGKLKELGIAGEVIARFQSRQNELKLIYQVKQAYFNLLLARQELQIARLSEKYLEHHLDVSQKLFKLGQISKLDLFFTQSELAAARENILVAGSNVDEGQIQLSNLTGLKIASTNSLSLQKNFPSPQNISPATLIYEAERYNPAISIFNQQIQISKLQKKLIQSSRLPQIYVGGGYVMDNDPTSGGNYAALIGGLQFPVFDWGMRKNKGLAFDLQSGSLAAARDAFLLELQTELQRLATRMEHFKNLLILKEKTVQKAQETYDYTEISYQSGIATNTEVLLAQKALIAAKVSKEKVALTIRQIQAEIELLIGKIGVKP